MKKLPLLSAVLVCLLQPALSRTAQADTIKTFVLNGTYAPVRYGTGVANGSFTVNVDTGAVLSVDFDWMGRSATQTKSYSNVDYFSNLTELSVSYGGFNGATFVSLDIILPVSSLVGYSGDSSVLWRTLALQTVSSQHPSSRQRFKTAT